MIAKIIGEDDESVGVEVVDNNSVKHIFAVGFDGEILQHGQDVYPSKANDRSAEEHELMAEARLFAKYTVYRERGYQTLPANRNPDRIAATLLALAQLSDEEFEKFFGTYYRQHAHHYQPEIEPPIEPPADIDAGEFLRYELDIYLGLEQEVDEAIRELVAAGMNDAVSKTLEAITEPVDVAFAPGRELGLEIDAVSDLRVAYQTGPGDEQVLEVDPPLEREPDTTLQLVALPSGSLEVFRRLLVHHLGCQIRDCYLEMGVEPPEAFRLLGHGFYDSAQRYRLLERYEPYFDFEADIPGYRTVDIGQPR